MRKETGDISNWDRVRIPPSPLTIPSRFSHKLHETSSARDRNCSEYNFGFSFLPKYYRYLDLYRSCRTFYFTDEAELALVRISHHWFTLLLIPGDDIERADLVAFFTSGALPVVYVGSHGLTSLIASYSSRVGTLCSDVILLNSFIPSFTLLIRTLCLYQAGCCSG